MGKKISELAAATTPLAGTELLVIVQGGATKKVAASAVLPSGAMTFKGIWDVAANSPTLVDGVGTNGDVYLVSVAGTRNLGSGSLTFAVGDLAVYNGSTWLLVPSANDPVTSAVVIAALGYTPARAFPQVNALGSISGAVNVDCNYKFHTGTLTGNVTLTFINPPPSGCVAEVNCQFTQDATGGRTISHAGTVKWPNGVPIDGSIMAASQRADIGYVVDNSANATAYPVENVA